MRCPFSSIGEAVSLRGVEFPVDGDEGVLPGSKLLLKSVLEEVEAEEVDEKEIPRSISGKDSARRVISIKGWGN